MCQISEKIKFCTCINGKVESLKHYWILNRFNPSKDEDCIGMPVIPTSMLDENFVLNELTLLNRLNEPDAFDSNLNFRPKDILEIVINNIRDKGQTTFIYAFKFGKGKWKAVEHDSFLILNKYEEEVSGKIKSVLKRKNE